MTSIVGTNSAADILDAPAGATSLVLTSAPANNTGRDFDLMQLQGKVAELKTALEEKHPTLPILLRTIHTQLKKDAELSHLLDDDEIGVIVNGLKIQTNTEIATKAVKEGSSATKAVKAKLAKVTADDI